MFEPEQALALLEAHLADLSSQLAFNTMALSALGALHPAQVPAEPIGEEYL